MLYELLLWRLGLGSCERMGKSIMTVPSKDDVGSVGVKNVKGRKRRIR